MNATIYKKKKRIIPILLLSIGIALGLCGCQSNEEAQDTDNADITERTDAAIEETTTGSSAKAATEASTDSPAEVSAETDTEAAVNSSSAGDRKESSTLTDEDTTEDTVTDNENSHYLIVIDPGHQEHGNSDQEPIGPGASETKAKVTSGTSGVVSGLEEYELNLIVSLKLRDELEARGYQVIMTRETNDINLSNVERAQIANSADADAFIRVHADGDDTGSAHGIMTICQTSSNPYNGDLYASSYALSKCVLEGAVAATGATNRDIWETDTMSGINWAEVPVTILEMGFMSNAEEDAKLATDSYQNQIAVGVANGVDQYFLTR